MSEIRTFQVSRLLVGASCTFHSVVVEFIQSATSQALHLEGKAEAYAADVAKLQELVNRQRAFVATYDLKQADVKRDNAVGAITNVVTAYTTTSVEEKRRAALRLKPQLGAYKGIGKHEYDKETSEINGLLILLEKEENVADIALLGLAAEVADLAEANALFKTAMGDKRDEMGERLDVMDTDTPVLLASINGQYATICKIVEVMSMVQPTPAIEEFIAQLNAHVAVTAAKLDEGSTPGTPTQEGEGGTGAPEGEGGSGTPEGEGNTSESGNENEGDNTSGPGDTPTPPAPEGGGNSGGGSDPDEEIIG